MAAPLAERIAHASLTALAAGATILLVAVAPSSASAAEPTCGAMLLADWQDGRLDGVYPAGCYREALESLPEDVRAYSTAEADITRALRATLRRSVTGATGGGVRRAPVQPSRPRSTASGAKRATEPSGRMLGRRAPAREPAPTVLRSPPLPLVAAAVFVLALGLAGVGRLIVRRLRVRRARRSIIRRRPHAFG